MSPLRDDEITTMLRDEVSGLASGPASLDDVLRAGRRRVLTRRLTAGAGALAVAAVVGVGLQLADPADDRGLPAQEPTVTLTEEPAAAPDPQPVYDALEVRLAEMGLPTDHGRWGSGPLGGVDDGTALSTSGAGFTLTTAWDSDDFDARGWCAGNDDCVEEPTVDGGTLVRVPGPDGATSSAVYVFEGGWVQVTAVVMAPDPDGSGLVDAVPLTDAQLVELATDPGLRWQ